MHRCSCRRGSISERQPHCKRNDTGANPVVGSRDRIPIVWRIGSDTRKVQVLVRVQVGILHEALRVCRKHGSLRSCRTRSDSSVGRSPQIVLGVWWMHATLRRSKARFDSWQGHLAPGTWHPADGAWQGRCNSSDAGARRLGGCLQSIPKRVRLPPASWDDSCIAVKNP